MITALLRRRIRHNFSSLERGEVEQVLAGLSDNFRFTFPGSHSFAASDFDKAQFKRWLDRLASLRPKFEVGDVCVGGPPWNLRIAFRLADEIRTPDGFVYHNEIVECARARWGKIESLHVFLDTQATAELDEHLPQASIQS